MYYKYDFIKKSESASIQVAAAMDESSQYNTVLALATEDMGSSQALYAQEQASH